MWFAGRIVTAVSFNCSIRLTVDLSSRVVRDCVGDLGGPSTEIAITASRYTIKGADYGGLGCCMQVTSYRPSAGAQHPCAPP